MGRGRVLIHELQESLLVEQLVLEAVLQPELQVLLVDREQVGGEVAGVEREISEGKRGLHRHEQRHLSLEREGPLRELVLDEEVLELGDLLGAEGEHL